MICEFCNRVIVDDARFCSYCGKKVKSGISSANYYQLICDYFEEIRPKNLDISSYFNPQRMSSMKDVFYQFCGNLQDYNMMPSVIGFLREDRKEKFYQIFCGYDKDQVRDKYTEESLFEEFCNCFPVKNKESKNNLWKRYARSIIDTCEYLAKFDSIDSFYNYIESYQGDLGVVNEMSKSIRGMGFALTCNMVKDLGFTEYAKPDTHTKDVIAAMGYSDDDISVIRTIQRIANENNDTAFNLDRMIWLICSGYYFNHNIRVGSHKKELIEKINNIDKHRNS